MASRYENKTYLPQFSFSVLRLPASLPLPSLLSGWVEMSKRPHAGVAYEKVIHKQIRITHNGQHGMGCLCPMTSETKWDSELISRGDGSIFFQTCRKIKKEFWFWFEAKDTTTHIGRGSPTWIEVAPGKLGSRSVGSSFCAEHWITDWSTAAQRCPPASEKSTKFSKPVHRVGCFGKSLCLSWSHTQKQEPSSLSGAHRHFQTWNCLLNWKINQTKTNTEKQYRTDKGIWHLFFLIWNRQDAKTVELNWISDNNPQAIKYVNTIINQVKLQHVKAAQRFHYVTPIFWKPGIPGESLQDPCCLRLQRFFFHGIVWVQKGSESFKCFSNLKLFLPALQIVCWLS